MKLESFKSELFNNEIKNPELIIGGKTAAGTSQWTTCTVDGCVISSHSDGPDPVIAD